MFASACFFDENLLSFIFHHGINFGGILTIAIKSNLICIIPNALARLSSDYLNVLEEIIKKNNHDYGYFKEKYTIIVRKKIQILYIRLFIFNICSLLLAMFIYLYISSFCLMYQATQITWMVSVILAVTIKAIFPFLFYFCLFYLRKISIERKIKIMYEVIKIVIYYL